MFVYELYARAELHEIDLDVNKSDSFTVKNNV